MRSRQLGFPWYQDGLRTVDARVLRGEREVAVEVREGLEEVALLLSTTEPDSFVLHIRVGHPAWSRRDGRRCAWDLQAGFDRAGEFGEAARWAMANLDPYAYDEELAGSPDYASLVSTCAGVTNRAVALSDPAARATAERLAADARMFAYAALLDDAASRVVQMIETSPAVITLAARFELAYVIEKIQAGVRRRDLIGSLLGWARIRHRYAHAAVTRAPAIVSADVLLDALKVQELDINDMPRDVAARACWFDALAAWRRVSMYHDEWTCIPMGGFVSCHGLALAGLADERGIDLEALLAEIVDWMLATNAPVPQRRTQPHRIGELVRAWHEMLWDVSILDPAAPLAPGPRSIEPVPGVELESIRTAGELYEEGRRMRHCVGSMAAQGAGGALFFYRGAVAGQPVTIAIAPWRTQWRLIEAAGCANTRVLRRDLIDQWINALEPTT